jgi:AhpD family alkylhydroperoxidase
MRKRQANNLVFELNFTPIQIDGYGGYITYPYIEKEHDMTRIAGVSTRNAGLRVKLAFFFTRRQLARLTGRNPERMLEPLEMYAHVPGLLRGVASLEQATAKLHRFDERLKNLAELKAATLTHCEYCIDLGSQIARRTGLSDQQLLALPRYRESELFTDLEKLVLDYAVGMSGTPVEVPDALFAELREHFDETQLVELTHIIALENMRGRFNLALGIGAAGFSEGMVCAVPATTPNRHREARPRTSGGESLDIK